MASLLDPGKIAIVCPVLNCLGYTKMFYKKARDVGDYKMVFINNNSNDGTKEYLGEISKNKSVYVINNSRNMGVAASWNFGVKEAKKRWGLDYFAICNNDILINKHTIARMGEALAGKDVVLTSATDVAAQMRGPQDFGWALPGKEVRLTPAPEFSCFMVKTETIEKIGEFDEGFYPAYFEDNDYHYRIRMAGKLALKTNQALYYHFGSATIKEGEEIRRLSNMNYLANKAYYESKWGGPLGQEAFTKAFNKE